MCIYIIQKKKSITFASANMWLESKEREGGQNDNTCFHRQCYMQKHVYIYIDMQRTVTKMWLESRSGRGELGGGRSASPKAE